MNIELREPLELEKEQMEKTVLLYQKELLYWKKKKSIKCYCTQCFRRWKATENEFKQIKYAKICPQCFNEIYKIKEGNQTYSDNVIIGKGVAIYGYWVDVKVNEYSNKAKFTYTYRNSVKDKRPNVRLLKVKGLCYQGLRLAHKEWGENVEWRKASHERVYENRSLRLQKQFSWIDRTKKQYLEMHGSNIVKSNQKKIAIDNLLNEAQIKAMILFNINDVKLLYKYRGYIDRSEWHMEETERYTPTTLIYLSKNKIRLSDYNDYANMCKELNRKLDRPKDFKLWHDRLNEMVEVKENEKLNKGIIKQFKKLAKYEKKINSIEVHTFKDYEEINEVAKTLHNCMARMYAEPYSKGKTELYYATKNGKIVIAIEVNKGRLIQVRANNNSDPSAYDKKIINKWFKEVRTA